MERARYYQWIVFLANTLQPAFRDWYYPEEAAGPEHTDAVRTRARQHLDAGAVTAG